MLHSKTAKAIAAILGVVLLVMLARYQSQEPPTEERDSGGVGLKGANLPGDLTARKTPTVRPDFTVVTPASDTYELRASTKPESITITVPLKAGIRYAPEDHFAVAVADSATSKWQLLPVEAHLSDDKRQLIATIDYPQLKGLATSVGTLELAAASGWRQFFSIVLLDYSSMLSLVKSVAGDVLTGTPLDQAKAPQCDQEAAAKEDGYDIIWASKNTDLVYWCMGIENGKRVVKIANRQSYALDLYFGKGATAQQSPWMAEFSQLARLGTGSNHVIIFPKETVTLNVSLEAGRKVTLTTEYSGLSQALSNLDVSLQSLAFMASKLHVRPSLASGAEMLNSVLNKADCYNAVASGNTAGTVAKCLANAQLTALFSGGVAMALGFITATGQFAEWFIGLTKGVYDSTAGTDVYRVVVSREQQQTSRLRKCGYIAQAAEYAADAAINCREAFNVLFSFDMGYQTNGSVDNSACKKYSAGSCHITTTWKCAFSAKEQLITICNSRLGRAVEFPPAESIPTL